jgi:hypothetical protein
MHKIMKDRNFERGREKNLGGGGKECLKGIKCNLWNGISWLRSGACSRLL